MPGTGIFMSRDAIFADLHQGWGYVGNNPVAFVDPYGFVRSFPNPWDLPLWKRILLRLGFEASYYPTYSTPPVPDTTMRDAMGRPRYLSPGGDYDGDGLANRYDPDPWRFTNTKPSPDTFGFRAAKTEADCLKAYQDCMANAGEADDIIAYTDAGAAAAGGFLGGPLGALGGWLASHVPGKVSSNEIKKQCKEDRDACLERVNEHECP